MNLDEKIREVFKRKEQGIAFVIDIYGDLYIGKDYDKLDKIGEVEPLVIRADDCDSLEVYKRKVIESVGLLAEYLDYYADCENERQFSRMLKLGRLYKLLTEE